MKPILALLGFVMAGAIIMVVPPMVAPIAADYGGFSVLDCARAVVFSAVVATIAAIVITRNKQHGSYLVNLFLLALFIRIAIGTALFVMKGQSFFGGDAWTYDYSGWLQIQAWRGDDLAQIRVRYFTGDISAGWGMVYVVGAIYGIVGRNMLATQFFNAILGAATAPIIFLCAEEIFRNVKVAKLSAIGVAFFPSLILWSSMGIKDGPIVFSLALAILATLKLGKKLSFVYVFVLIGALFAVLSLRFYTFYMLLAAVVGAFVVGMRAITAQSFIRQFLIIIALGLSLTYLGVTRYASQQFEEYGSLERLQRSRQDMASSADSGFGKDIDVSTTSGALVAIPVGLIYLLLAPFPWQLMSVRSSITLPEMVVWWACFPLLITGFWFSIKYRLRQMSPILILTTMLTLAYSVMQGNVGNAYRQRSQLLIFYFIFVAVGIGLVQEKRQERKARAKAAKALQRSPGKPSRQQMPQQI